MKFLSILLVVAAGALAGCSTTANNSTSANNANIRGANTNTGYVNTDANPKPTVPVNPTVVGPASAPSSTGTKPMEAPKATKATK